MNRAGTSICSGTGKPGSAWCNGGCFHSFEGTQPIRWKPLIRSRISRVRVQYQKYMTSNPPALSAKTAISLDKTSTRSHQRQTINFVSPPQTLLKHIHPQITWWIANLCWMMCLQWIPNLSIQKYPFPESPVIEYPTSAVQASNYQYSGWNIVKNRTLAKISQSRIKPRNNSISNMIADLSAPRWYFYCDTTPAPTSACALCPSRPGSLPLQPRIGPSLSSFHSRPFIIHSIWFLSTLRILKPINKSRWCVLY